LPLSTDRVESTIPGPQVGADVAEGGKRWLYPSPQMFYNAMRRKGYEPKEEEMRTVVAIHNTVNERTWHEVLEWESMHPECLEGLKLVRFGGKPDEPSMKVRLDAYLRPRMTGDIAKHLGRKAFRASPYSKGSTILVNALIVTESRVT